MANSPRDNGDHFFANLQSKHDYIYILAEIDSGLLVGAEKTGVPELTLLTTTSSLGEEEMSHKFQSKSCYFTINGRVIEGILCFATKEFSLVDGAKAALKRVHALRNQYGIYVITKTTDEVNHEIVLNLLPQHENLKKQHNSNKHTDILHQHTDRSYMEKLMMYLKAEAFDICNNQEDILYTELKKESWQLVQYSTKPNEVIFKVVPYIDTKWQDLNKYKDAVAFIRQGNDTYQAIVVFTSISKNEILTKFKLIQQFLKTVKVPVPSEIDARIKAPTPVLFKRSTLFQRAEERDSDGQRRSLRNNLEEISDCMLIESYKIVSQFIKTKELDRSLRHYVLEKGISLDEVGFTPESSVNTLSSSTPTTSDIDSS